MCFALRAPYGIKQGVLVFPLYDRSICRSYVRTDGNVCGSILQHQLTIKRHKRNFPKIAINWTIYMYAQVIFNKQNTNNNTPG